MTPPTPCPVCRCPSGDYLCSNSDFLFATTSQTFDLYRCHECGSGYLSPPPDPEQLHEAYPDPYWWITLDQRQGLTARLESFYRESVLRHHVSVARRYLDGPAPKVLDIGCGSGTFLHVLAKATGVEGEGLEVSPSAAQAARQRYGLTVHEGEILDTSLEAGTYDLITMFHVLEHLPAPHQALTTIHRALAPGGCLLVQVPNLASWQFHWFGRRWTGIDIPRHLIDFTPASLKRILIDTGFSPERPRFFSLRDNAPAMISSLSPGLDPVAMNIRGNNQFAFCRKLLYFTLVLLIQPLALLEAAWGKGGTMFMAARK